MWQFVGSNRSVRIERISPLDFAQRSRRLFDQVTNKLFYRYEGNFGQTISYHFCEYQKKKMVKKD